MAHPHPHQHPHPHPHQHSRNSDASTSSLRPIVLSGPSGAGKSTVLKILMSEYPGVFGFSVSHTTRKPRPGETHGVDYYFVEREEMLKMIEEGHFIENAQFSGNLYGTSKQAVLSVSSSGKICILDVEKKGCENLRKTDLNPKFIQIRPPDLQTLEQRLRSRNTESEESLRRRLEEAVESMQYGEEPGNFHHVVVNHTVEEAYAQLKEILAEDIAAALRLRAAMGLNVEPGTEEAANGSIVEVTDTTPQESAEAKDGKQEQQAEQQAGTETGAGAGAATATQDGSQAAAGDATPSPPAVVDAVVDASVDGTEAVPVTSDGSGSGGGPSESAAEGMKPSAPAHPRARTCATL